MDMTEIGWRLKTLRERRREAEKGWSQSDLAKKLSEYVTNALDGENGKTTISQLERGQRSITVDLALAYSEVFNVSLDYILGKSDDWQPSHKTVKEATGLPDAAIAALDKSREYADLISLVVQNPAFSILMSCLEQMIGAKISYQEIHDKEMKKWSENRDYTPQLADEINNSAREAFVPYLQEAVNKYCTEKGENIFVVPFVNSAAKDYYRRESVRIFEEIIDNLALKIPING